MHESIGLRFVVRGTCEDTEWEVILLDSDGALAIPSYFTSSNETLEDMKFYFVFFCI